MDRHTHTHTHMHPVVEIISEFAFICREYPAISSRDYCKDYLAAVIRRMVTVHHYFQRAFATLLCIVGCHFNKTL